MLVAFLGTGNALPSVERGNTMLALAAGPGAPVTLIDAGGDPYRALQRAGINAARVNDLILTHAHIDHLGGLPSLIESFRIAGRQAPLRIFANPHALGVATELLRVFAFELTLDRWPFAVELHTIAPGTTFSAGEFSVEPIATEHAVPSVGLRVRPAAGGPVFAYTSDSRDCPALRDIARGAALLVTEATYTHAGAALAQQFYHLTITQAAQAAAEANAGALALVHLTTPHRDERAAEHEARRAFRGPVIVPRDGAVWQVQTGRRGVTPLRAGQPLP